MDKKLKILVVDDNRTAVEAMQKLLRLRGHTVEIALTGEEAIAKTPEFDPQVILLDIGLPDMDGYVVAHALREQVLYRGTLIALTGYGQDNDKEKATSAGFQHHLTKPAGLAEIEEILATIS